MEEKKNSECTPIKKHYIISFFICLGISAGLIITSFYLPPKGEVHPSTLQAVGELFLYPTLAFGAKALEEGKNARIQRGNTTITVGDDKDKHRHHPDINDNYDYQGTEDYQPHS